MSFICVIYATCAIYRLRVNYAIRVYYARCVICTIRVVDTIRFTDAIRVIDTVRVFDTIRVIFNMCLFYTCLWHMSLIQMCHCVHECMSQREREREREGGGGGVAMFECSIIPLQILHHCPLSDSAVCLLKPFFMQKEWPFSKRPKHKFCTECFVLKCSAGLIFNVQSACVSNGWWDLAVENTVQCRRWHKSFPPPQFRNKVYSHTTRT